jgi:hypothetical protein
MIKYSKIALLVFACLLLVFTGCITIVVNDDTGKSNNTSITGGLSEEAASAIMFKFAVESELAVLQVLEIFSDGFSQPILGQGVEISLEDYDTIMNTMSEVADMGDDVSAALIILVPPELANRQIVHAGFMLPLEHEGLNPPPQGIVGSFLDFFSFAGGAGKRASERIEKLTKNTPAVVKNDMFESLPAAWKEGASNSDEWFSKLKNGDYNKKAAQIHKHFSIAFAGDYGAEAAAQGERPIDVAAKEGAQMVKKGTQFYIDAGTTIVNAGAPGFSDAVSQTQAALTKVNQYEGYVKTCYKDGISAALKQAAKDKLDEQVTGQLQNTLGENFSDAVMHFTGQVMGTNKPSDLIGKVIGSGKVKVTDAGNTSTAQVAVALNQDDSAGTKMVVTVTDSGQPEMYLPEGKYVIVASDTKGKLANESNVTVTAGKQIAIAMQPKPSGTGDTSTQIASGSQQNGGKSLVDSLQEIQDAALAGIEDATDSINNAGGSDGSGSQGGTGSGNSLLDSLQDIQDAALAGLGDGTGTDTGNQQNTGDTGDSTGTGSSSATTSQTEDTTTDSPPPAVSNIGLYVLMQAMYDREKSSLESAGKITYKDIYYYQYVEDGRELRVLSEFPLTKVCPNDEGKPLLKIEVNAGGLWDSYERMMNEFATFSSLEYMMTTYKGVPAAIQEGPVDNVYRYEIVLFDPAVIFDRHPEQPHCGISIYGSGELTGLVKKQVQNYADLALEIGYSRGIFRDYDSTAP